MLGLPQTQDQRNAFRDELLVFIVTRAQDRRLHDILVVCCEISQEDADMFAEREVLAVVDGCGSGGLVVVDDGQPAVVGESSAARAVSEKARDALRWATSVREDSIIEALALELPAAVVEEQIALHGRHLSETAVAVAEPIAKPILVYP